MEPALQGPATPTGSAAAQQQETPARLTVTALLGEAREGSPDVYGRLFPLVYDELRSLARRERRRLPTRDTLNTTALVHEAFIKLAGAASSDLHDRAHFMAVSSIAMRQILIGYARRQAARKRGGGRVPLSLEMLEQVLAGEPAAEEFAVDLLVALDVALTRLGRISDRQRRVVECRFFGGMSIEETAVALHTSPATVKRDWAMAQAWLYRELREETP